ncbi:MAG: DUF2336 domain-containing protein [Variibacter sp.]
MTAQGALIKDVENVVRGASPLRRANALKQVTTLFLHGAGAFSDAQIELFDDVFRRLVIEIEAAALVDLAQTLAPIASAPPGIIRTLAHDNDIAVAGPVLSQSPRLTDEDLIVIAQNKPQAHLLAISGRKQVSEHVTNELVRRGDLAVLDKIVSNQAARFSDAGFAVLVSRAAGDRALSDRVGSRADIPAPLFRKLVAQATATVRERLIGATGGKAQDDIARVTEKAADDIMLTGLGGRDYAAVSRRIDVAYGTLEDMEARLVAFAAEGRVEETVVAISQICRLSIEVADRLVNGGRPDSFLILGKAMQFQWSTVAAVIALQLGADTPAIERARGQFDRLSSATSERVLGFWQARAPAAAAAH